MGGGPSTPANTTTTATQELPMWAIPSAFKYLEGGMKMAEGMKYQPYTGQRIAKPVGMQQMIKGGLKGAITPGMQAINQQRSQFGRTAAGGYANAWSPNYGMVGQRAYTPGAQYSGSPYRRGEQFVSDAYSQAYKDPAQNPWLQKTYQQASRDITDQYAKGTAASRNAAAARAGAMGGSAAAELAAMDEYGLGQNLKNLATDIYGQNYQQERAREFAWQQQAAEQGYGAWAQDEAQRAAYQQQAAQQGFGAWAQNEAQRNAWLEAERQRGYDWLGQERGRQYDWRSAERQRQLQAAQALGGLAGQQQQLYSALQPQADFRQQLAQQGLDTRYADFLEQRDFPLLQYDVMGSILSQALGHAGGTTTTLNQGYFPGSGGFGSAIGGALGGGALGYGLGQQFGGYGGYGAGIGALLGGLGSYFG